MTQNYHYHYPIAIGSSTVTCPTCGQLLHVQVFDDKSYAVDSDCLHTFAPGQFDDLVAKNFVPIRPVKPNRYIP